MKAAWMGWVAAVAGGGLVAAGHTRDEILREYPYLEAEDITEALSTATS